MDITDPWLAVAHLQLKRSPNVKSTGNHYEEPWSSCEAAMRNHGEGRAARSLLKSSAQYLKSKETKNPNHMQISPELKHLHSP